MKLASILLSAAFLLGSAAAVAEPPSPTASTPPVPSSSSAATPAPAPSDSAGKCLTPQQLAEMKAGLEELDGIHKAPAVVTSPDAIVIIQDWTGRVYTNGGQTNPIRLHLQLGPTVSRDMALTLPTQVYVRPKPEDPMFRLRVRAQAGVLLPQLVNSLSGNKEAFWDAGIGWDFFHYKAVNVAAYTGVRSLGGGVGLDLTRNFGPYLGYSLIYDGFKSSAQAGVYFSFN